MVTHKTPPEWVAWARAELEGLPDGDEPALGDFDDLKNPAERRALGQFFTSGPLAKLLAAGLAHKGSTLDPACGGGSLLRAVAEARYNAGATVAEALADLVGVDIDPSAVLACRATLVCWAVVHWDQGPVPAPLRVFVADGLEHPEPADQVIINPPYLDAKAMKEILRARLKKLCPDLRGAYDLYACFVRRMMDVVKPGGRIAMLVPGKILQGRYAASLRSAWLSPEWTLESVVDLTSCVPRPFPKAGVYPVILTVKREGPSDADVQVARITDPAQMAVPPWQPVSIRSLRKIGGDQPLFVPRRHWDRLTPLWDGPRLATVAHFVSTCSFHRAGLREQFVTAEPGPGRWPYLGGASFTQAVEVGVFRIRWAGSYLRYDAAALKLAGNPLPPLSIFARPKIIIAQHALRLLPVIDYEGVYVTKDVYPVGAPIDPRLSLDGLCALLASTVFTALYNTVFHGVVVGGETYHYLPAFLHQIPIPVEWQRLNELAPKIRALHAEGPFDFAAWTEVDRAVTALYGLTEEDRLILIEEHLHRVGADHPEQVQVSQRALDPREPDPQAPEPMV